MNHALIFASFWSCTGQHWALDVNIGKGKIHNKRNQLLYKKQTRNKKFSRYNNLHKEKVGLLTVNSVCITFRFHNWMFFSLVNCKICLKSAGLFWRFWLVLALCRLFEGSSWYQEMPQLSSSISSWQEKFEVLPNFFLLT